VVLAGVAAANVPLRDYWGVEASWHSARALALGGQGETGPSAVFGNPALLGFVRRPVVELTYGLAVADEERTRVVYDQFENTLGEMAVANNTHAHGLPGPACGALPLGPVCAAAGITPARDFAYSYLREYRDDFYSLIGEERVEQSGTVYDASIGLGFSPLPFVSVGAAGSYLFGSRRLETMSWSGAETLRAFFAGRPRGVGWAAGVALKPAASLAFAVDFASGVTLADWSWSEGPEPAVVDKSYPSCAGAGLEWRIPGALPAVASARASYTAWSTVDSTQADVLAVRAGVEHLMLNFVRLRYGFGVEPLASDLAVQVAEFSFGLGFDVGKMRVDAGALLARDVIGAELFTTPPAEPDLRTYETRSTFALSVSRAF
jgi:hypothetical protein